MPPNTDTLLSNYTVNAHIQPHANK